MIVEIDLFSGRPNPHWVVDEGLRWQVLDLESRLMPATGEAMELPGLGYRGFIYSESGWVRRAFGGLLEREGAVFEDRDRTIERRLLTAMPVELAGVREKVAALLP